MAETTTARRNKRSQRRFARRSSEFQSPINLPFARAASIIAVVLLAGALFGYDQGVISGALIGIQKAFDVGTSRSRSSPVG